MYRVVVIKKFIWESGFLKLVMGLHGTPYGLLWASMAGKYIGHLNVFTNIITL